MAQLKFEFIIALNMGNRTCGLTLVMLDVAYRCIAQAVTTLKSKG